ncbi:MAG: hypothetical protein KDD34_06990 [Bdellovibrionales bacterium]|nr:hypothetical protein [Bdellovibrionales bacterium]
MPLRTLLATLFLFSNLALQTGCALMAGSAPAPQTMDPVEQVYATNFDAIWLATQKAMAIYPMRVNNMDVKILETDTIKIDKYWNPPHVQELKSGQEYRLVVRVIEGELDGKPAQKVSVSKIVNHQKDFFSNEQQIPSSGLEEKALLYRIERELTIERGLERAQKKANQNS